MKHTKRLAFECNACGKVVQPRRTAKDGFQIIAHDSMIEWSDFTDYIPELDEQIWLRSDTLPIQNEIRTVKVCFPFNFELGEQFWALFRPANSSIMGWSEYPNEIDASAIIKCQFEEILDENKNSAWIHIRVLDVLLLREMCNHFPVIQCDKYLEELKGFEDVDVMEYGDWIVYSWTAQGDLGTGV